METSIVVWEHEVFKEPKTGLSTHRTIGWRKDYLNMIGLISSPFSNTTTLCIIYQKGKRPDLGYSVNNKNEEK